MIGRLSSFDLPARLTRLAPAPVVQIAVGVVMAALGLALRVLAELAIPGVASFALLFPAILIATGLAGWEAGAVAMALGGVLSWRLLMGPHDAWVLAPVQAASLSLYAVSGALMIAAAAAYRATALALRASRERLDLATAAAQVGIWEWRPDTGEMYCSDEARRIYGFRADQQITYEMVRAATHPEDAPQPGAPCVLSPDARGRAPREYRIVRQGGEVRWVQTMGRAVFESRSGGLEPARYVGVVQDVSARKAADERMRLLAREVDHRANNLLAVVQGTVALSQAADASSLKRVITGRVNALARAHQLLANARWEGADLRRLVEEELSPFSIGDEKRVALHGPVVALAPAAAQSVAMALHELATNAAKYGALSASQGFVDVRWGREAGDLRLIWSETGGPPVQAPERRGLGTTLLARALAPIGGETRLEWRPEGLVCALQLPASALEAATG